MWIERALHATPKLAHIRMQSHRLVIEKLTDAFTPLMPRLTRDQVWLRMRTLVEFGYVTTELLHAETDHRRGRHTCRSFAGATARDPRYKADLIAGRSAHLLGRSIAKAVRGGSRRQPSLGTGAAGQTSWWTGAGGTNRRCTDSGRAVTTDQRVPMSEFLSPATGRAAASHRAKNFRESERQYRELAEAETLPRLKAKYIEAAESYARLSVAEQRLAASPKYAERPALEP